MKFYIKCRSTNKKMEFESSTTKGFSGKKVEIVLGKKRFEFSC